MTTVEAVLRAQEGDREALERLLVEEMRPVCRLLATLLPPSEVEDVAQDVRFHAWMGLSTLRRPELFVQWLRTVAFNRAMAWQRRRYTEARFAPRLWNPEDVPSPEMHIVSRMDIVRAMGLLPPEQRDAILLQYVDDLSSSSVAQQQGTSAGTVRWRVHQARKTLRKALQEES